MSRLASSLIPILLTAAACGGDATTPESTAPGDKAAPAAGVGLQVPAEVATEVGALRERVQRAFQDDDASALAALFAEGQAGSVEAGFPAMRERVSAGVEPLAALYARLDGPAGQPVLLATGGDESLRVTVQPAGREAYVWLGRIAGGFRDSLLGEIWQKGDAGWRLHALRVGALSVGGKSGTAWYREAVALQREGQSLPAYLRLTVAADLMHPLPFVEAAEAGPARDLLETVRTELSARYIFPMKLDDLPHTPQVVRIIPAFPEGKLSPGVHYVTEYALADAELGTEAQSVADKLGQMFPGFCHDATHVALAAFSEVPADPNKRYESVGLVATCN